MVWQLFLLAAGFQREIRGKHLRFLGQDVSFKLGRFNIKIVNEDMSDTLCDGMCYGLVSRKQTLVFVHIVTIIPENLVLSMDLTLL